MTWIQTYTGRQFWPLDPRPEHVDIRDIAHALALTCRFNGHCRQFYSVAEHSVRVMGLYVRLRAGRREAYGAIDRVAVARALLHDAAEAYLGDVVRPLKPHLYVGLRTGYWAISTREARILDAIHRRFQLWMPPDGGDADIRHADAVLLATEARDLMGPPPAAWEDLPEPLTERIVPWPPDAAEAAFLRHAGSLGLLPPEVPPLNPLTP